MYTIAKRFTFSASHQLNYLPEDHPCARLHGHNYEVEVILAAAELDERGFVIDYGELTAFRNHLDKRFDHRHLNDVLGSAEATTAENLAHLFYDTLANWLEYPVIAVRVSETPKTWAAYRPGTGGESKA